MTSVCLKVVTSAAYAVKLAFFFLLQTTQYKVPGSAILSGEVSVGDPVVCSRFHEDIFLLLPFVRHSLADGS